VLGQVLTLAGEGQQTVAVTAPVEQA